MNFAKLEKEMGKRDLEPYMLLRRLKAHKLQLEDEGVEKKIGCTRASWGNWKNDTYNPHPDTVEAIAYILSRCPLKDLSTKEVKVKDLS